MGRPRAIAPHTVWPQGPSYNRLNDLDTHGSSLFERLSVSTKDFVEMPVHTNDCIGEFFE